MDKNWRQTYLRALPGVDAVVTAVKKAVGPVYPHRLLVKPVQRKIDELRRRILQAEDADGLKELDTSPATIAAQVKQELAGISRPSLRRVICYRYCATY